MYLRHAYYYVLLERSLTFLENIAQGEQRLHSLESPGEPLRLNEGLKLDNPLVYADRVKLRALERIDELSKESAELGLKRTDARLKRIRKYVESAKIKIIEDNTLIKEIRVLKEALEDDLTKYKVFIPSLQQADYYNQSKLFGDTVYDGFPSARQDILEAGNCYATDNNTACVFHLMRITEKALRALAKHLRADKNLQREIDYEDWKKIDDAIGAKLKILRNTRRGSKRQAEIDFYADAADQLKYFKELWRDNIMHSRTTYNDLEALNVLTRVGKFLELLSKRIAEKP